MSTISSCRLFPLFAMTFFTHFCLHSHVYLPFLPVRGPFPRKFLNIPFAVLAPTCTPIKFQHLPIDLDPFLTVSVFPTPCEYSRVSITCPNVHRTAGTSVGLARLSALPYTNVFSNVVHCADQPLSPAPDALRRWLLRTTSILFVFTPSVLPCSQSPPAGGDFQKTHLVVSSHRFPLTPFFTKVEALPGLKIGIAVALPSVLPQLLPCPVLPFCSPSCVASTRAPWILTNRDP